MSFFRRRATDAIRGAGEALFPKNTVGAPDFEETALVARMEAYLAVLPPPQQRLVYLLFIFVELVAPIFLPRLSRYSKLSPEMRCELVRRFRGSRIYPLRLIGDSIKGLMTMIYMSHPRALAHIGAYTVCDHPEDRFQIDVRIDALTKVRV